MSRAAGAALRAVSSLPLSSSGRISAAASRSASSRLPQAASISTTPIRKNATPMGIPEGPGAQPSRAPRVVPSGQPKDLVQNQLPDFNLSGKTYVVTGGARGLGLTLAEGIVEAGGNAYCIDRLPSPDKDEWQKAQSRIPSWGGSLIYKQQDISDTEGLKNLVNQIAEENDGLHGAIAAAAIQHESFATDLTPADATKMMDINFTGALMTANTVAQTMLDRKCQGSICFIASMSGLIANKGLFCPVYNSSKAAVIQLAKCLAMEWSPMREDGSGGIRVNCISPGHIMTPMVQKTLDQRPEVADLWSRENMMGRLADTREFKGAALYLLSNASSYMTGSNMVLDGGHTAW